MKNSSVVITMLLYTLLFSNVVSAYDENTTHKTINDAAVKQSNLNTILQQNLGIQEGTKKILIENKSIEEWIAAGGKAEDEPFSRGNNHFHDPTKAWNEAGLNTVLITGDSSIIWAQKTDQGYTDSDGNYVSFGGTWSWPKARDYYYLGLTATTKEVREQNLANTFKTVGHIMHLVSDVSVPAHTRNDAHLFPEPYEAYTRTALLQYNGYATVNFPKLTDFWDEEHGKGLSEFTNANFYSRDTNKNSTEYANPQVLSESQEFLEEVTDADGNKEIVTVRYGLGTVTDSYSIIFYTDVKLTAYSLWDFDYNQKMGSEVYSLNDTIHQTYADFLIPRAVGYSAGLVNYFFRGEIEALNSTPINDSVGNITGMKMKVKNNTPDEAMSSTEQGKQGKLVVAYQYKDLSGNELYGLSGEVLVNEVIDSGEESAVEYDFVFANPIPLDAQEIKYWLVYRGKLGSEEDAAVGRMFETKFYGYLIDLGDPEAPINIIAKRNHYTLERYGNYISEPYSWPMKIGTTATLDNKYFYRSLKKDDGSVVILKSSIIDMTNEEEIFFAWPTPIFEEAPNGVHSFTTDGEFFYFTYYFTDIDYITFYKLLKYSKAGGDIIAELDWPHIRDNSSFEIKCDDSYLYIIRDLFSLSPRQFIIEVRNKSDFNLVTTIQLDPLGHDYFYRLFVDKNLIYVNYTDFSYPYGFHHLRSYSKDKWKLVESRFLEFLQYGRINTHDDKFFYAHNEFIYPDPYWSTEDQYIRIDKQTFEISVKNLGPGLFTSSWFNGLLSSYEYFIAEGLDKKGYKFEYGTEE